MRIQSFTVNGFMSSVQGYALGAYYPLTIKKDGAKARNPAFDHHSQQVLNLKDGTLDKYLVPAIKYCAPLLAQFLKNHVTANSAEFLIIPSSTAGKTSFALDRIVKAVCTADKRFSYRPGALFRHKSIDKLSKGGDRSLDVHLQSMSYKAENSAPLTKIILDDVTTSGNSIAGAIVVVEQIAQGVNFVPIVFGKTTHD